MLKKILSILSIATLLTFLLAFFTYLAINFNILDSKKKLYEIFPNFELRLILFKNESEIEHFKNDYNVKFLPFTQFEKLEYLKKKINFENNLISLNKNLDQSIAYKRYNSFYVDFFNNFLLITDHNGNVYFIKNSDLFSNSTLLDAKNIKSDLRATRVFDSFIYEDRLYISFTTNNNNCNKINVSFAKINLDFLKFQNLFSSKSCNKTGAPGRIQFFEKENIKGILLSTSEGIHDKPGSNTQNQNSIFGKILFIPFNRELPKEIYSMGHRVIQGLNVNDNVIISTEHGPRGGDEINRILLNKNYGWPIASLGERYDFKYDKKKLDYKKDHLKLNFEEPIFSFIPSIGISEIIKLPSKFSIYYNNHYLLSSLNGKSLYLIRFNSDFKKIISFERVFINNRIRDIKYSELNKSIILALEENGEIGIISNN